MRSFLARLDAAVQIFANGRDATAQIEVACRTVTNSGLALCDELDFLFVEVYGMGQNCVRPQ